MATGAVIPDFIFNVPPGLIGYDIETYPNIFTCQATHEESGQKWYFEISWRKNDHDLFKLFLEECRMKQCEFVGYNNVHFDYPVIHMIYNMPFIDAKVIYDKAMSIINAPRHARFAHLIWERDQIVPQIDLLKMHHFDNPAKMTSLKILEFNMRMDKIEDLPFDVGTMLNDEQADFLGGEYNDHDVNATLLFKTLSEPELKLRRDLSATLGENVINCSDVKIGEKLLVKEMEKRGIQCYEWVNGKKKKRQTKRDSIDLSQVIFPYIKFERAEFQAIYNRVASQVITGTKGVFADMVANVEGLDYKFGTGGLHASVESQIIESDDQMQIVDVDVASYYPNLAIKNKLYPAHLGPEFCDAYLGVYETRKTFPKKTPENEAYKLALNGAYGGSNNEYSPFLDPFYTMSITINGQFLLCVLAEQLIKTPGLKMIQCNTDGVTYICPKQYLDHTREVCRWWEQLTQLELEEALYSRMFIRDVNSYIAEFESGDLKRIGAYAYVTAAEKPGTRELPHHKDWSFRVVAKAAEAALVHGQDIRDFIENHDDVYDFFGRTKVPRSSTLKWGNETVPNIVRYYVAVEGAPLEKVMPPAGPIGQFKKANGVKQQDYDQWHINNGNTYNPEIHTKNESKYEIRRVGIQTGYNIQTVNDLNFGYNPDECPEEIKETWCELQSDINIDWYVAEAKKLVNPLLK